MVNFEKNRLEAFSDGVLAIILTIMVLELKVPEGESLNDLFDLAPHFFSYVLSFVYVGIYWNNHHHMLHTSECLSGVTLWANLHLLFWLSLVPFTTGWMGTHDFSEVPTFLYGANLLAASISYYLLQLSLIRDQGPTSRLKRAVGRDVKGKVSLGLHVIGLLMNHWSPLAALAVYALVAVMWFFPDRRIERAIS